MHKIVPIYYFIYFSLVETHNSVFYVPLRALYLDLIGLSFLSYKLDADVKEKKNSDSCVAKKFGTP